MKIIEVYIDGFRNIKETRLDFSSESIIVLLAPNNYGKSNLLLAIQNGFDLIAKQGTQVVKYIQDSDNYFNWNIQHDLDRFTFGVKFAKINKQEVYHYQYSLAYRAEDVNGEKKSVALGVSEESLSSTIGESDPLFLFKRIKSVNPDEEDTAELSNGRIVTIPCDYSGRKNYVSSFYLGLHKLGNMAIFHDEAGKTEGVLREISGVLTSLTRENIGDIIAGERSDFYTSGVLAMDAVTMIKRDNDYHTKEFPFFVSKFKALFPYYNSDDGVSLHRLGDSGQYQLLFRDSRKVKQETSKTLSFGTRRVFKLLSQVFANETPLISLEEIETGLHPELYSMVVKILFEAVDAGMYKSRNLESRLNDPRLLISSHAPGIVNALEGHLDSIYIVAPDLSDSGIAQFAKLNDKGKAEVRDGILKTSFRTGDIIFSVFSEGCLKKENLEFLDLNKASK